MPLRAFADIHHRMANDMSRELIGGILMTFGLALLAFTANRGGHLIIAAILAVAAWLSVGLDVLIWFWSR